MSIIGFVLIPLLFHARVSVSRWNVSCTLYEDYVEVDGISSELRDSFGESRIECAQLFNTGESVYIESNVSQILFAYDPERDFTSIAVGLYNASFFDKDLMCEYLIDIVTCFSPTNETTIEVPREIPPADSDEHSDQVEGEPEIPKLPAEVTSSSSVNESWRRLEYIIAGAFLVFSLCGVLIYLRRRKPHKVLKRTQFSNTDHVVVTNLDQLAVENDTAIRIRVG